MAITNPDKDKLDTYGVERAHEDEPGFLDRLRENWPLFDHIMRMQERYTEQGGNQYSAGITYFSVMTIFPLMMLLVSILAMVLAGNPDLMDRVIERAAGIGGGGQLGDIVSTIIKEAVAQRASVFSIGLLLALWTGLYWMGNLRMGVSAMWKVSGVPDNFFMGKIRDFLGLIGLLAALIIAFGITTIGNSGLTETLLGYLHLDNVPGIRYLTFSIALVVALIANFLVFAWMIIYLPRTSTPRRSTLKAAVIGAVAFEAFKQFATMFFSNALSNPAGAAFGPIIGIMVLMYFIWRILLYCSAWAATTPESLAQMAPDAPPAAVIRVRQEVRNGSTETVRAGLIGGGAAVGVLIGGLVSSFLRRR